MRLNDVDRTVVDRQRVVRMHAVVRRSHRDGAAVDRDVSETRRAVFQRRPAVRVQTVVARMDRDRSGVNDDLVFRLDSLRGIRRLGRIAAACDLYPVAVCRIAGNGGQKVSVHGGVDRLTGRARLVVRSVRRRAARYDVEQDIPVSVRDAEYEPVIPGASAVNHRLIDTLHEESVGIVVVVKIRIVVAGLAV